MLTPKRLDEIDRVLGSCSLERDSGPSLHSELFGHITALNGVLEKIRAISLDDTLLYHQRVEKISRIAQRTLKGGK